MGCQPDSDNNLETQKGELVFDKRNVEGTRGLWEWSRLSPPDADLGANLAALSRASAVVYSKKLNEDDNCKPAEVARVAGSASMTSDTRALSAFHVCRTDVKRYNLRFESPFGSLNADDCNNNNYTDCPGTNGGGTDHEWTQDYRYHTSEDSPFLANRLFSLGLEEWADYWGGVAPRQTLREGWWFDIEEFTSTDPHYVDDTWFNQGFMPLDPTLSGKDLVLLKVRTLDPPAWGNIEPFSIDSPSVFFDQVELAQPQFGFLRTGSAVEAVYNSDMLEKNFPMPSACTEGGYEGSRSDERQKLCLHTNAPPVGVILTGLHRTTLDSAPGTSGGAATAANLWPAADGWSGYRFRQAFGVVTGGAWTTSPLPTSWGDPVSYPEYHTMMTEIGHDWVRFNRDGDIPAFPFPTFGPTDYIPPCTEYDVTTIEIDGEVVNQEVCVGWGENDAPSGTVQNSLPSPTEDPSTNTAPGTPQHGKYFSSACESVYATKHPDGTIEVIGNPGMVYGLMGSIQTGVDNGDPTDESVFLGGSQAIANHGGGIGSFFMICGPRSSVDYTSNWRFLHIKGNTIKPEWDTMRGTVAWGEFRRALVSKYEKRRVPTSKGVVSVNRPVSFKMCPPGFALSGFDLTRDSGVYTSVARLHCIGDTSGDNRKATIELHADSSFDGYTLFGRDFDLSQMIGLVDHPSTNITEVRCDNLKPIIAGLKFRHDQFGRLNYVWPICGFRP